MALLAVGAGATVLGLRHSSTLQSLIEPAQAQEKPESSVLHKTPATPVAAKPIFVKLDPFTVTLRADGYSRILYTGITIQTVDQASADRITQYMPAVRNRILMVLAKQSPESVTRPETMDAIKGEVLSALAPSFEHGEPVQKLRAVLFTAFVVQ